MIHQEAWIYINEEKTKYIVTTEGQVIATDSGIVMRGGRDKDGYHLVSLTLNKRKYTRKIHRLVAIAFIPNPLNLPEVNHKDGDKWNNCVDNLEWTTTADNVHHAHINGLRKKVIIDTLCEACRLLETGEYKISEIVNKTGLGYSQILKLLNRKTWEDITKNYDFTKYNRNKFYLGEDHPRAVLSEYLVHKICRMLEDGYKPKYISDKLNVSLANICHIKNGECWKHISINYRLQR